MKVNSILWFDQGGGKISLEARMDDGWIHRSPPCQSRDDAIILLTNILIKFYGVQE